MILWLWLDYYCEVAQHPRSFDDRPFGNSLGNRNIDATRQGHSFSKIVKMRDYLLVGKKIHPEHARVIETGNRTRDLLFWRLFTN